MTFDFDQEGIILDACCIINLYASSVMGEVLESIPFPCFVDEYVREKEALKIKAKPKNEFIDIDLEPLIEKKILKEISLSGEEEKRTFVNLAAALDDGEARCGAIAANRNLVVATDEKAGIRVFSNLNPPISTVSTLSMLHNWAVAKNKNMVHIRSVLKRIEKRASYRPGLSNEYFNWWEKHMK
jgi:predicted nucleic acid-binding protein